MAVTRRSGSANSGYASANNDDVVYGQTPQEGNLMVVHFWTRASNITTPTGWTRACGVGAGSDDFASFWKVAGTSEGSSTNFTVSAVDQIAWAYDELIDVDTTTPVRAYATEDTTGATTSRSSGTTDTTPQSGDFALAGFGSRDDISGQSFTNSFTLHENAQTSGGTVAEITTAYKALTSAGAVETTMSWSTSSSTRGLVVVYRAGGTGVEGSATLTGVGTLQASGQAGTSGSATLNGVGTLSASGTIGTPYTWPGYAEAYGPASTGNEGTAVLVGVGTMTASGQTRVEGRFGPWFNRTDIATSPILYRHTAGRNLLISANANLAHPRAILDGESSRAYRWQYRTGAGASNWRAKPLRRWRWGDNLLYNDDAFGGWVAAMDFQAGTEPSLRLGTWPTPGHPIQPNTSYTFAVRWRFTGTDTLASRFARAVIEVTDGTDNVLQQNGGAPLWNPGTWLVSFINFTTPATATDFVPYVTVLDDTEALTIEVDRAGLFQPGTWTSWAWSPSTSFSDDWAVEAVVALTDYGNPAETYQRISENLLATGPYGWNLLRHDPSEQWLLDFYNGTYDYVHPFLDASIPDNQTVKVYGTFDLRNGTVMSQLFRDAVSKGTNGGTPFWMDSVYPPQSIPHTVMATSEGVLKSLRAWDGIGGEPVLDVVPLWTPDTDDNFRDRMNHLWAWS